METLRLVTPTRVYESQIIAYRQDFLRSGDDMHGCSMLQNYASVEQWLEWVQILSNAETCPAGFVVSEQYLCVRESDDCVVGMINIRYELNDYLFRIGGHIGYSIRPSERQKGYAKMQLSLMLQEAKKRGLARALVTCDQENEASRRTILANGGVMENEEWDQDDMTFVQRYWIDLT